jgi:hypothetical protein
MCSVSVLQPPPVTLSPGIKNIAVVNRCETTPPEQAPDATGKIFSPEAALESINGLADELNKNNRFTEVKYLDKTGLATNAATRFPAPLAWDTVQRLCRQSNADVLFVLEVFDNDSKMNYATHAVNVITSQGKVSNTEHQANMLTRVKTGWRIYDPANKKVCDEFIVASDITFDGKGISKRAAEAAVIGRNEAVQEVGNKAGHEYAARVVPYHLKVMRTYYTSGSDNFKMAAAKCKAGDWDGASALWQKETTSRSKKLAGQACYNMAIVSEINGDLKLALQWAQKAYDKNSSTLAQDYITILQERKKNKSTGPPKQSE